MKLIHKNKVKIVIRNEAIKLYTANKTVPKIVNENNFVVSPYFGYVMEARLLAGSTLVHLSLKVNETDFHVHARLPGLNFFSSNEKVKVLTDPSQIFVFEK